MNSLIYISDIVPIVKTGLGAQCIGRGADGEKIVDTAADLRHQPDVLVLLGGVVPQLLGDQDAPLPVHLAGGGVGEEETQVMDGTTPVTKTLSTTNNWSDVFTNLPAKEGGKNVTYFVKEAGAAALLIALIILEGIFL